MNFLEFFKRIAFIYYIVFKSVNYFKLVLRNEMSYFNLYVYAWNLKEKRTNFRANEIIKHFINEGLLSRNQKR